MMPRRFAFWNSDIWMPAAADPAEPGAERRNFILYGRLKPGLEVRAAEAELGGLAQRLSKIYPRNYPDQFTVRMDRLGYFAVNNFRTALLTLLAAVGLLLLIACQRRKSVARQGNRAPQGTGQSNDVGRRTAAHRRPTPNGELFAFARRRRKGSLP